MAILAADAVFEDFLTTWAKTYDRELLFYDAVRLQLSNKDMLEAGSYLTGAILI